MRLSYYKWELGTICNECGTISSTADISTCPKCGVMDDHRRVGVEYVILAEDVKFQTGWIRENKDKSNRIHRAMVFKQACQ